MQSQNASNVSLGGDLQGVGEWLMYVIVHVEDSDVIRGCLQAVCLHQEYLQRQIRCSLSSACNLL
jgi:hypothetical protein